MHQSLRQCRRQKREREWCRATTGRQPRGPASSPRCRRAAAVGVGADASLVAVPVESVAWLEVRRLCAGLMVVVLVVVVVVQLCGVP